MSTVVAIPVTSRIGKRFKIKYDKHAPEKKRQKPAAKNKPKVTSSCKGESVRIGARNRRRRTKAGLNGLVRRCRVHHQAICA